MSRDPLASLNNDAESALSDDELDGVVGGYSRNADTAFCSHGSRIPHRVMNGRTDTGTDCPGPLGMVVSSGP